MYRNFYSYNDMPQLAHPPQKHTEIIEKKNEKQEKNSNPFSDVIKNLKNDDLIPIIVILFILNPSSDIFSFFNYIQIFCRLSMIQVNLIDYLFMLCYNITEIVIFRAIIALPVLIKERGNENYSLHRIILSHQRLTSGCYRASGAY